MAQSPPPAPTPTESDDEASTSGRTGRARRAWPTSAFLPRITRAGVAVIKAGVVAGALSGMMVYAQITIPSRGEQTRTRTIEGSPGARPLTVVALGDSVVWGLGCECDGYVHSVAQHITEVTGRPSVVHNEAIVAGGSQDMLDRMGEEHVKEHIRGAELVVIEIGANDFAPQAHLAEDPACQDAPGSGCYAGAAATMLANLRQIVKTVRAAQWVPGAEVVLLGYWNVFEDGDVGRAMGAAYVAGSDSLSRWVNAMVAQVAAEESVTYADAYTPFKAVPDTTALLAPDGDHPNAAGHAVLAQAVWTSLGSRTKAV